MMLKLFILIQLKNQKSKLLLSIILKTSTQLRSQMESSLMIISKIHFSQNMKYKLCSKYSVSLLLFLNNSASNVENGKIDSNICQMEVTKLVVQVCRILVVQVFNTQITIQNSFFCSMETDIVMMIIVILILRASSTIFKIINLVNFLIVQTTQFLNVEKIQKVKAIKLKTYNSV